MPGNPVLQQTGTISSFTSDFIQAFQTGLQRKACVSSESLNIMRAANLNYLGQPVPADLFEQVQPGRYPDLVDYCRGQSQDGVVQIPEFKYRRIGRFQGHFNTLRAMKRQEALRHIPLAIDKPFDPNRWHFGKIHPEEIFHEFEMDGRSIEFLYNMFPFAPYHFLLVPERGRGLNQFIGSADLLKLAWRFVVEAQDPSIRLGYNAIGGYASIDHFHYQGFYVTDGFKVPIDPLIDAVKHKVEVLSEWPVRHTTVFKVGDEADLARVFGCLQQVHEQAGLYPNTISYNLYIRPDSVTLFSRTHHCSYSDAFLSAADFVSGLAFFEMAGTMIMVSRDKYEQATEDQIAAVMRGVSLGERPFSV